MGLSHEEIERYLAGQADPDLRRRLMVELFDNPDGETARYLRGEQRVSRALLPGAPTTFLVVEGATHHNLKDVTVRFPMGRLTSVTGVSGYGKSSLVEEVLHRAAVRTLEGSEEEPVGAHRAVRGLDAFRRQLLGSAHAVMHVRAVGDHREIRSRTPQGRFA